MPSIYQLIIYRRFRFQYSRFDTQSNLCSERHRIRFECLSAVLYGNSISRTELECPIHNLATFAAVLGILQIRRSELFSWGEEKGIEPRPCCRICQQQRSKVETRLQRLAHSFIPSHIPFPRNPFQYPSKLVLSPTSRIHIWDACNTICVNLTGLHWGRPNFLHLEAN